VPSRHVVAVPFQAARLVAALIFFAIESAPGAGAQGISARPVGESLQGVGRGGTVVLALVIIRRYRSPEIPPSLGEWAPGSCSIAAGSWFQHDTYQ